MKIRQETPRDYERVYQVVKEAFASAAQSDGNEQELVTALRSSSSFIPELSLVAEEEGEVIGHILFTKASVGEARYSHLRRCRSFRHISAGVLGWL